MRAATRMLDACGLFISAEITAILAARDERNSGMIQR
jgi:hypothetical protein